MSEGKVRGVCAFDPNRSRSRGLIERQYHKCLFDEESVRQRERAAASQ